MTKKITLPYFIIIIALVCFAYRPPVVTENENRAAVTRCSSTPVSSEIFIVDLKQSVVTWRGSMSFAGKGEHIGYVYLAKGEMIVEKHQLVGGTVEVDMNSIADKIHGSDNGLVNHLKDPDFFDVKKFPIASFAITRVAPADAGNITVTGSLTIKGITHEISFPARADVKDKVLNANGKVTIDRTLWDVRYNSGKFYDNLADEAISDDIELDMKIVARK